MQEEKSIIHDKVFLNKWKFYFSFCVLDLTYCSFNDELFDVKCQLFSVEYKILKYWQM